MKALLIYMKTMTMTMGPHTKGSILEFPFFLFFWINYLKSSPNSKSKVSFEIILFWGFENCPYFWKPQFDIFHYCLWYFPHKCLEHQSTTHSLYEGWAIMCFNTGNLAFKACHPTCSRLGDRLCLSDVCKEKGTYYHIRFECKLYITK